MTPLGSKTKSTVLAPSLPSSLATSYLRSYSHMKYMNPPPPAPVTLPPIAPAPLAASYILSMDGLVILSEKRFLWYHPWSRISPASRILPLSTAMDISTASSLVLSRASSFWPWLNLVTWLSIMLAESLLLPR